MSENELSETRHKQREDERKRVRKQLKWNSQFLDTGSGPGDHTLFMRSLCLMVDTLQDYSEIKIPFEKLKSNSKWHRVIMQGEYDEQIQRGKHHARKTYCPATSIMKMNANTTGRTIETDEQRQAREFREKVQKRRSLLKNTRSPGLRSGSQATTATSRPASPGRMRSKQNDGQGNRNDDKRAQSEENLKNGDKRAQSEIKLNDDNNNNDESLLTPDEGPDDYPNGRDYNTSERNQRATRRGAARSLQQVLDTPHREQRRPPSQLTGNRLQPMASHREDLTNSQISIATTTPGITNVHDIDAQEDCVLEYLDHGEAVNRVLGPVLRQLVDSDLLMMTFNEVYEELHRPGGQFNVITFLRLAQDHYAHSTPMAEMKGLDTALRAVESSQFDNHLTKHTLTTITTTVRTGIVAARNVAHAGNGSNAQADRFHDQLQKKLVLIALSKSSNHTLLFGNMSFLDALTNCRDNNWTESTWSAVVDHIMAYESATIETTDTATDEVEFTNTYNAGTSVNDQSKIPGEVTMPQIRDIRKEMLAWNIEWKNGTCYTCGDLPCKYKQTDGHCAGRGTTNGRANRKFGFLQKSVWNTSNANVQEKSTTKAMYTEFAYAGPDSNSDSENEYITIHEDSILVDEDCEDSILVDEDCEKELERMPATTSYMVRTESQMTDEIEINNVELLKQTIKNTKDLSEKTDRSNECMELKLKCLDQINMIEAPQCKSEQNEINEEMTDTFTLVDQKSRH